MNKECPVCKGPYTETQWRQTKAGGYRAFRHFDHRGARWCKGKPGAHYAQLMILGERR